MVAVTTTTTIPTSPSFKTPLTQYGREALIALMQEDGESAFRAKQLLQWIYEKRVTSFDEMSNLSLALREKLASRFVLRSMTLAKCQGSADTTQKFLFRLTDGRYVECVLIPASLSYDGERSSRHTLCVSSQVGCAYGCKFCASGLAGFSRNLTTSEIVEQVLQTEAHTGKRVDNLVFMGMGEPLANLTNLMAAIEIINAHWGIEIGARHLTVSTSGLAPQIKKLADQPLQIRLAISLHGASDEVRDRIMPVNRKYPLERLFESLQYYKDRKKQRLTFEYILIEDVNDALSEAGKLARLAKSVGAKVNLIPYNMVDGLDWKRPSESQQQAFAQLVKEAGVTATLRTEKGHDIDAACGQLRLKEEFGSEQ
jgi:23S rRNA (adenine2503-C2)-methyltransferase